MARTRAAIKYAQNPAFGPGVLLVGRLVTRCGVDPNKHGAEIHRLE
jgi:hypothetical protein